MKGKFNDQLKWAVKDSKLFIGDDEGSHGMVIDARDVIAQLPLIAKALENADDTHVDHVGFSANRLSPKADNPMERAFAEEWRQINVESSYFTPTINHLIPSCTKRDAQVAATIIQWLGSSVGAAFVNKVMGNNDE